MIEKEINDKKEPMRYYKIFFQKHKFSFFLIFSWFKIKYWLKHQYFTYEELYLTTFRKEAVTHHKHFIWDFNIEW